MKDVDPPDRLASRILFGLHLLVIILAGILPFLLMTQGETAAGRWVGLAIFTGIAGTLSLWIPRGKRARMLHLGLVFWRYWEEEDHFLLFSQRAEISETLVRWARDQVKRPASSESRQTP